MSLPKDIARHRLFWTWHRRIGIVAALLALVLSLTGLALNHTESLRLDERRVSWGWLLDWYGISPPDSAVSFVAGSRRVTLLGDRLYLDAQFIPGHFSALDGAVSAGGFVALVADGDLILLSEDGQLVDRLGAESGIPSGILELGAGAGDRIVLRTEGALLSADVESLEWQSGPEASGTVRWAAPEPVGPELMEALQRDFRSRILPLERVILDLHSGRIGGPVGVVLMDAAAILLLALALTGSWLWLRRRGQGM